MEILQDIVQGTDAWHQIRAKHFTASEASAMMGRSKYMTRSELLKQKHTGIAPDVDAGKQYLFDRGHAAEALARPFAEQRIGDELFPCTGVAVIDGLPLLASFDGITMDERLLWENKLLNQDLCMMVEQGDLGDYCWQLEQQLLVSDATKVWFTTSDGTQNNTFGCWYYSDQVKRKQLIAGWKQFAEDLKAFTPTEAAAPVVAHVETLPAVSVRLGGELTVASNLPEFSVALRSFITRIPVKPSNDQEFADCDSACKSLKKAEDALEAAESNALAQMTDFEAMRRVTADLRTLARDTRLACEKLVKQRKDALKIEIISDAQSKLNSHIATLNRRTQNLMPRISADFATAAKNKRNFDSLQNGVDTELARAKIEASAMADLIQANLETKGLEGYKFLFSDLASICTKANDDFVNTVNARIAAHEAKEAERIKAETARIAEQERIKAEAAAKSKADADIAAALANERAKVEAARVLKPSPHVAVEGVAPPFTGIPEPEWVDVKLPDEAFRPVFISPSEPAFTTNELLVINRVDSITSKSNRTYQRAATRSLVDNILDGVSEAMLQEVLQYLQNNFVKQAA